MSQAKTAPAAAAAAAPAVPSRGNSQLNKRASSIVKPAEPVVEEEGEEEESEYSEGEDVPAGAAAAAPAAPAAVSATPRRNSSAASGASSNSTASLPDASSAPSHFGVSLGEFSGEPWAGGLKKMPRQSSLPSTPVGRGVSTLHRELNDVDIPPAIFMSPFPLDTAKGHRKSLASTQGWEGQSAQDTEAAATAAVSYDKSESDDDEEDAKPAKKLRPTSSQEQAERAKKGASNAAAPSKKDTPTINRARSRLNTDSSSIMQQPATIKETRGSSIAEEFAERAARRPAMVAVPKTSDGGLIRNVDSTFPWLTAALLLLVLAQFVLLCSVGKSSEDVLGLNVHVTRAQTFINNSLATYVQPLVAAFQLPVLDLHWFDRIFESTYAQFWLVPLLYILAGAVVRKAFEVTARDALSITGSDALESTERKQAQYAHHVFVACNAFAGALSFWAFFMASEKFGAGGSAHVAAAATPRAPAAAGAPAAAAAASTVPTFSPDWYAAQLIISSLSWSLSELVNFSDVFSGVHTTLYVLLTLVTEAAFWSIMPLGALAAFPEPARKVVDLLRGYLPKQLNSLVLLLPLLCFQAAESIKALAGLAYGPIGRVLLWLVPLSYAFGVFQTHAHTEQLTFGLQGLLLLATLAFLSTWEICSNKCQIIVRKSKQ